MATAAVEDNVGDATAQVDGMWRGVTKGGGGMVGRRVSVVLVKESER